MTELPSSKSDWSEHRGWTSLISMPQETRRDKSTCEHHITTYTPRTESIDGTNGVTVHGRKLATINRLCEYEPVG